MLTTQSLLLAVLCGTVASLGLAKPPAANAAASDGSERERCQLPEGEFNLNTFQLYPENVAFDEKDCWLYLSVLYNASVAVYDIRKRQEVEIISFPEITGNVIYHASGVRLDPQNLRLLAMTNAGAAFDSQGANVSGPNDPIIYGLEEKKILSTVHLNDFAPEKFRGFQDMDIDDEGNIFPLGTYGGIILRISADDEKDMNVWYKSEAEAPVAGVSGMGKVDGKTMVVADSGSQQLLRISMEKQEKPHTVNLGPGVDIGNNTDGMLVPSEYGSTVALVADAVKGIMVIHSQDKWETGKLLRTVPNKKFEEKAFAVATVEVGGRLHVIHEYFLDGPDAGQPAGTPGSRSEFPVTEITEDVRKMVLQQGAPSSESPNAQYSGQAPGSDRCEA